MRSARTQAQRNRLDRAQVRRNVFADAAVAARSAAHERAVAIVERDREPVDLQLADVLDGAAGELARALVEGAQLVDRNGIREAEHRPRVFVRREAFRGGAPTRCVGESGVRSSGCFVSSSTSSRSSASNSASVICRIVEHVVAIVRLFDLLAQRFGRA